MDNGKSFPAEYLKDMELFNKTVGGVILKSGYYFELAYDGGLLTVELRRRVFGNLGRLVDYAVICNGGNKETDIGEAVSVLISDNFNVL